MIFLERGEDFIPLAAIIQQATNRRWILKLSSISSREQIMTLQKFFSHKCSAFNAGIILFTRYRSVFENNCGSKCTESISLCEFVFEQYLVSL